MPRKKRYMIAVKREQRANAPGDLATSIADVAGAEICSGPGHTRLIVDATDEAISIVRRRLSDVCHIESPVDHKTQ